MIKYLLAFVLFSTQLFAQSDLEKVRLEFFKASANEDLRTSYFEYVMSLEPENTIMCYQGAAHTLVAGESYNPYTKLSKFLEGKALIEKSIANEPENAELRYIRFLIQTKAPSFLNYNENIAQDYNHIIKSNSQEIWMKHFQEFIDANPDLIPNNG